MRHVHTTRVVLLIGVLVVTASVLFALVRG